MPYGPYNFLSCRDIPVTVSKAFKRVWIRDNSKDEKNGLAGLGEFEDSRPLVASVAAWRVPAITDAGVERLKSENFNYWTTVEDSQHQTSYTYLTRKGYWRHKCDRLLLAQNCFWEEGTDEHEGQVRIRLGPYKWYCPKRSGGASSEVTGKDASVRPWTGPAGDIAGWIGGRFADFLPLAVAKCPSGHTRDTIAQALLNAAEDAGSLSVLPDAWGLGDPPKPLYKVHYVDPSEVGEDKKRRYGIREDPEDAGTFRPETEAEALAFVEGHAPTKMWFWEEYKGAAGFDGSGWNTRIPSRGTGAQRAAQVAQNLANEDDVLAANAASLEEWDSPPALSIAHGGTIAKGDAFDAMFLTETWKVKLLRRDAVPWGDPNWEWEDDGEGLLLVDSGEGEGIYVGGDFEPGDISGIVGGNEGYVFWRGAVRRVKRLPPASAPMTQEGGE